ncbi:MAG: pyrrolo-quinoline quinone, partial [Gemmataceae bacterium]
EHLYLHLRNQRFAALNLRDGEPAWVSDKPFGKYWSLVRRADRLLALDQRGDLLLIRANPDKLELLDLRHLTDDTSWAHLAVAGDDLIVRDLKGATAYRWKRPSAER